MVSRCVFVRWLFVFAQQEDFHMSTERCVDHSAIRVNQAFTMALLGLAFVLDSPVLATVVAAVMLTSAFWPKVGLFHRVYRHLLRPVGIIQPDVIVDNPEPHRFAQGFGGAVVTLGAAALSLGVPVAGWGLVGLVMALAGLNLFAGWCAGCTMYYWLNRFGIPGFGRSRIEAAQ
jgi:hypothetical protein